VAAIAGETCALVVEVRGRFCAVPSGRVIETMRALPVEPIAAAPAYVLGVALIRGAFTPVVDLGLLIGTHAGTARRFVTVRTAAASVALAVDAVAGVRELDATVAGTLPPLLTETPSEVIESIGQLDAQLLLVLRASWELSPDVLHIITCAGETR
jgi:purine-binding chemotaxis protein CheW